MRKLRPKEIELLRAFPKEMELWNGVKCGGVLWPFQHPKGMPTPTIRNAYKLGLVRVARSGLIEHYPLELTEAGKKALASMSNDPGEAQRPDGGASNANKNL
jgi:hypothetical protein